MLLVTLRFVDYSKLFGFADDSSEYSEDGGALSSPRYFASPQLYNWTGMYCFVTNLQYA